VVAKWLGRTVEVLVEGKAKEPGHLRGHTQHYIEARLPDAAGGRGESVAATVARTEWRVVFCEPIKR
jgi:tRNA A37 methylthiotransferase MiaB